MSKAITCLPQQLRNDRKGTKVTRYHNDGTAPQDKSQLRSRGRWTWRGWPWSAAVCSQWDPRGRLLCPETQPKPCWTWPKGVNSKENYTLTVNNSIKPTEKLIVIKNGRAILKFSVQFSNSSALRKCLEKSQFSPCCNLDIQGQQQTSSCAVEKSELVQTFVSSTNGTR